MIHDPIYIYNFPANTGTSVSPETVLQLATMHPNIVGIKDTMVEMSHTHELIKTVKSKIPTFEVYSGFDDNFAPNVLAGGDGCIAALSNVVPEVCAAWAQAFRNNDLDGTLKGQKTINRLVDLYAIREPFLPVLKEACKLCEIASSSVGTFPMSNATVEDDAKISLLLSAEGIHQFSTSLKGIADENRLCLLCCLDKGNPRLCRGRKRAYSEGKSGQEKDSKRTSKISYKRIK